MECPDVYTANTIDTFTTGGWENVAILMNTYQYCCFLSMPCVLTMSVPVGSLVQY